jgi:hypothetical protein
MSTHKETFGIDVYFPTTESHLLYLEEDYPRILKQYIIKLLIWNIAFDYIA